MKDVTLSIDESIGKFTIDLLNGLLGGRAYLEEEYHWEQRTCLVSSSPLSLLLGCHEMSSSALPYGSMCCTP